MSHRTAELPPLTGLANIIRELRYHEFSRQALGLLVVVIIALLGKPQAELLWAGLVPIAAGTLWRLYAAGCIVKNAELATSGPYSVVRHPLYTGNIVVLAGFVIASGLWWSALIAIAFVWFYYPPAIEYEDRKLKGFFAERWEAWSADVPALIPASLRMRFEADDGWSFTKCLKQNFEPLVVAFVAFWFWYLWRQI
jgi:isoprenylcysteine carboxyl methyltransferase (ICMT) family protein YpbQ